MKKADSWWQVYLLTDRRDSHHVGVYYAVMNELSFKFQAQKSPNAIENWGISEINTHTFITPLLF